MDAHGVARELLNLAGTGPFEFEYGDVMADALHYDPGTNCLITAQRNAFPSCGGFGGGLGVTLRKLQLTPDGTRAWGPVKCTWVPGSPLSTLGAVDAPSQFSPLPGGDVLLSVITTGFSDALPRLVRVHPYDLATSTWSVTGPYLAAGAATACYSTVLGRAVLLDNWNDQLRLFAEGEDGDGTIVVPSVPVSAPVGNWPKEATVVAIPFDECTGGFGVFGLGSSGTGAAAPFLKGLGCPSPGASVTLRVSGAPASAHGLLFVGLTEAAVPFKGGTLYVHPVLLSLPVTTSPGGVAALGVQVPADPTLSGVVLVLQAAFESAAAAQGVALTQGLELRIP